MKDWNAIARELSSGEDSDAEDSLNVMQVQKNARRVAELMHTFIPDLAAQHLERGAAPLGMNRPDLIRDGLASTIATARRSVTRPKATSPNASQATPSTDASQEVDASQEADAPDASQEANAMQEADAV